MIWVYRLLFLPAFTLALPYYLIRMWRRGGYRKGFAHRFGLIEKLETPPPGTTRVWLQAVSVGEVLAAGPLIRKLNENPAIEIVLTTTTSTGYAEALKKYAGEIRNIGIFPLDFWIFNRCAWKRIRPGAILLMESELWPEHLHRAHKSNIPAFLINARLSDRSYRRYASVRRMAAGLLRNFSMIYAASGADQSRFLKLGCTPERIMHFGNIKFDVAVDAIVSETERQELRYSLGFHPAGGEEPFVIVGASTWPGEEAALIDAQRDLRDRGIDCRLLIVPRHAERKNALVQLLDSIDRPWHQRSKKKRAAEGTEIYLADTTGELTHLMQAADIAFIGKSLPPNDGGQTPIEAAGLGIPCLLGPNMSNFKEVTKSLVGLKAARIVENGEALKDSIRQLCEDQKQREAMKINCLQWHAANRGSSHRIANELQARIIARD